MTTTPQKTTKYVPHPLPMAKVIDQLQPLTAHRDEVWHIVASYVRRGYTMDTGDEGYWEWSHVVGAVATALGIGERAEQLTPYVVQACKGALPNSRPLYEGKNGVGGLLNDGQAFARETAYVCDVILFTIAHVLAFRPAPAKTGGRSQSVDLMGSLSAFKVG